MGIFWHRSEEVTAYARMEAGFWDRVHTVDGFVFPLTLALVFILMARWTVFLVVERWQPVQWTGNLQVGNRTTNRVTHGGEGNA